MVPGASGSEPVRTAATLAFQNCKQGLKTLNPTPTVDPVKILRLRREDQSSATRRTPLLQARGAMPTAGDLGGRGMIPSAPLQPQKRQRPAPPFANELQCEP